MEQATANMAMLLAAKAGVNVIFYEDRKGFSTDGKTIYISSSTLERLEASAQSAGVDQGSLLLGVLAHEAGGHIAQTDFEAQGESNLANSILNLLEDIRIEKDLMISLPGSRKHLDALAAAAGEVFWQKQDGDIANAIAFYLMRRLRVELLKNPLKQEHQTELDGLLAKEGALELAQKLYRLAKRSIQGATETADLVECANLIARALAKAESLLNETRLQQQPDQGSSAQEAQQEQEGGAPEQQEQPQDADEADQGAGHSGDTEQAADEPSQGLAPSESDQAQQAQADALGLEALGDEIGADLSDSSFSKEEIQRMQRGIQTDLVELVVGQRPCKRAEASSRLVLASASLMTPQEFMDAAKVAAVLRTGLADTLRSLVEDEDDSQEVFGRFDWRLIPQAATGLRRDVFSVDGTPAQGLDAHVIVALDCSGSMKDIIGSVRVIAKAVIDAFATVPEVKLSMIAYNDNAVSLSDNVFAMGQEIKRLHSIGGTAWNEALSAAMAGFVCSKKSRKILLTITDGDIAAPVNLVMMAKSFGIEHGFVCLGEGAALPASSWARQTPWDLWKPEEGAHGLGAKILKVFQKLLLAHQ